MATSPNKSDAGTLNLEQLMQLGIQTARTGNKPSARVIFQQILDIDKKNERAWLWMAAVADSPADRARYLNTVLRLNPRNATALRELDKMRRTQLSSNTRVLRFGFFLLAALLVLIVLALAIAFAAA
jgi:hypothetical protein